MGRLKPLDGISHRAAWVWDELSDSTGWPLSTGDVLPQQVVDLACLLHLHHVTRAFDYLDDGVGRRAPGVPRRNDPIPRPPHDEHALPGLTETASGLLALAPLTEKALIQLGENLGHAVEPLVLQQVVEQLATDELRVGEELLDHGLQVPA